MLARQLRRVSYCDAETGKRLKFLTNNFTLPAASILKPSSAVSWSEWQEEHINQVALIRSPEKFDCARYLCPKSRVSAAM
jgi:hypothetical protein